jgi:hypothetical protein
MKLRQNRDFYRPVPNGPFSGGGSGEDGEGVEDPTPGKGLKKVRARLKDGKFKGDDTSTPDNEAWTFVEDSEQG